MRNEIKKALQEEAGQGMTEYIIIVALIAIAAIGVITLFGEQLRDLFGSSAAALAGNVKVKRAAGSKSASFKIKKKGLSDAGANNESKQGKGWNN